MHASRASIRAFRAVQTRNLHMTGPATFSSILTSDKPTGAARGPAVAATTPAPSAAESKPIRHFNTSRSLKAVKDSSTIDFAFIPDFDPDTRSAPVEMRVPVILSTTSARVTETEEPVCFSLHLSFTLILTSQVMVPTVHTVGATSTHVHAPSAMFDMTDHIDFQSMASQVTKLTKPVEEGVGMARQLWTGLVDDIFGPKQTPAKA
jgi:hypothetical protein